MSDLISRSEVNDVIDKLEVYTSGRPNTMKVEISVLQLQRLINKLKNIPTAYDIYKVVEELELHSFELGTDSLPVHYVRLNDAIEIVKQGGIGKVVEQMERLTNRIFVPKEERELVVFTQGEYIDTIPAEMTHEDIRKVLRKLAEYEDLEEQGLLLRLPCKVGDTVYHVVQGRIVEVSNVDLFFLLLSVAENRFNKTVFLTKAEAEQKLKEMESD